MTNMKYTEDFKDRCASSHPILDDSVPMVEWGASSYFSFLEGCSSPSRLIRKSIEAGYEGIGLADRMGLYGCVEALRSLQELKQSEDLAIRAKAQNFFYAPGIRLHFDHADPLLVYPLHKKAHSKLCRHLSDWALEGVKAKDQEKGLPPLKWRSFLQFLRASIETSSTSQTTSTPHTTIAQDFLIFAAPGRYFPWSKLSLKKHTRSQTQDVDRVAPSYAVPPHQQGQTPLWLKELSKVCGKGEASALSLMWPLTLSPGIRDLQSWLMQQSQNLDIPLCVSALPLFAEAEDLELAQLVTSIRHRVPLKDLGLLAQVNSERRILSQQELHWHRDISRTIYKDFTSHPDFASHLAPTSSHASTSRKVSPVPCPFERSLRLKDRQAFSLFELNYKYPIEKIPEGKTSSQHLRTLVREGIKKRYPKFIPHKVLKQLRHELALIEKLEFEDYFLTIYEILDYAREQKILFQGRGSAANSAVCYVLGITAIDPVKMDLLFERFLSQERNEAPDIDIDFEHERREEVLQEIYSRYGRHHAAMVANTIRFRGRMAMRESGKALGFSEAELKEVTTHMGREGIHIFETEQIDTKKIDTAKAQKGITNAKLHYQKIFTPKVYQSLPTLLRLARQLIGLPRHMGLHSCGFVLAHGDLRDECILEPASKSLRSVIPWNKDDIDVLRWVKVDLLSLGMLTAIRKCFDYIGAHPRPNVHTNGAIDGTLASKTIEELTLANIPQDCPKTYQAFQRADTIGVFQIESRAQMNMLPRLVPRNFYDIVVQVAIVRPGPLQGGMVHPYLRRRQGRERATYAHPRLEKVLGKTLGVPIFQEQVMKMAVEVANFTPGESEQMRKVMSSAWRSRSQMHKLHEKLVGGMIKNGISKEYAERIYQQMEAFGEYGFPESHSASFAILAYISGWLKVHYPAEFLCSLLNSQPMGFYSPRALIGDAQRHGVRMLAPDIRYSKKDSLVEQHSNRDNISTPEVRPGPCKSVRLGLQHIQGLRTKDIEIIERLQQQKFFTPQTSLEDLRTHLSMEALGKIIRSNAFRQTQNDNRAEQSWQLIGLKHLDPKAPLLIKDPTAKLAQHSQAPTAWQSLIKDYKHLGFSVTEHPAHYARINFFPMMSNWTSAKDLWHKRNRSIVSGIGLLAIKQKPPTAKGMCFLSLEDESGFINLVLDPKKYMQFRRQIDTSPLIAFEGSVQKSAPSNPSDIQSSSLSIQVSNLWNPFERAAISKDSQGSNGNLQNTQLF